MSCSLSSTSPRTGQKRRSQNSALSWRRTTAVPALMQLAMINEALKHFDAARDAYEKVLTIAPNLPLALNNLAVLYSEHLGQFDKAYDLAKTRERGRERTAYSRHARLDFVQEAATIAMLCRCCRKLRASCLTYPKCSSMSEWRITWWARTGLPALRCRRPSTRLLIFRQG